MIEERKRNHGEKMKRFSQKKKANISSANKFYRAPEWTLREKKYCIYNINYTHAFYSHMRCFVETIHGMCVGYMGV